MIYLIIVRLMDVHYLYGGKNYRFTNDRFGKSNGAISLYDGYLMIASPVNLPYEFSFALSKNLTIMAWIKIRSFRVASPTFI